MLGTGLDGVGGAVGQRHGGVVVRPGAGGARSVDHRVVPARLLRSSRMPDTRGRGGVEWAQRVVAAVRASIAVP